MFLHVLVDILLHVFHDVKIVPIAYLMILHIDTNDITADIGTTVPKNVTGAQIYVKNICPCSIIVRPNRNYIIQRRNLQPV